MNRLPNHLLAVFVLTALLTDGAQANEVPSYQRHIAALFSRLGCNGGTCHGAVRGQNGFRLSLFGAEPLLDHDRLLHEVGGRRLSLHQPEASLLLLKATGAVAHQGGKRLDPSDHAYQTLQRWIAAGAPADPIDPSRLRELRVEPSDKVLEPGATYCLRVEARFVDGSAEDVTAYCSFESRDASVATVNALGEVRGHTVGDTALIVRYRATPAIAQVLVARPGTGSAADVPPHNFVDEHILAKLRRLNLTPAPLADDAVFLRRVSLDVTGELPSPDEVRAFLADRAPQKRTRKIEELLNRPGHAALWTLKFCDILKASDFGVYADALTQEADAPRFQAWVRARLEENLPYDQFVERILTATSREGRSIEEYAQEVRTMMQGYAPGRPDLDLYRQRKTLDLYWQRAGADGVGGAMQVAHAFLGLRLECAQCHRHPHDVWQQDDLLSFANFFMRVRRVGFQGDNEKRFPDAAALFKQFNEEGKKLEAEVKKLKEGEGKQLDEDAKKAKAELEKLTREVAQLEKDPKATEALDPKRKLLAEAKETVARQEKFRQEVAELEKRAKLLPEAARRLLQAECRLLPPGPVAKVTSPIGTQTSSTYRLLGESEAIPVTEDQDPRAVVMAWMRRPDNPFFARAIVNRVWAHYFGRGLVNPPDNLSSFNPATHPELLRALADGFIQNKYDLRWLHRTLLASRTYQQTSSPERDAVNDQANYAAFPLRRLPAEVLLDAINDATGTTENMDMKYHHWPEKLRIVEVPFTPRNAFVAFGLEHFGRPKRNAAVQCDCERDGNASVLQVLTLANHPRVLEKIADPNGRVARIVKDVPDATRQTEELFLAAVSRLPDDRERAACQKFLEESASPEKGLQGILWSLMNTREFLLQH